MHEQQLVDLGFAIKVEHDLHGPDQILDERPVAQVRRGGGNVGADAPEMIQMAAIAVKAGLTKAQWDSTCALHPTAAEELVTMHEKYVPAELAAAE